MRVRRAIKALSLNIEIRDAQENPQSRSELLKGGGAFKVPCLRITDAQGTATWIYESAEVVRCLHQRFAAAGTSDP